MALVLAPRCPSLCKELEPVWERARLGALAIEAKKEAENRRKQRDDRQTEEQERDVNAERAGVWIESPAHGQDLAARASLAWPRWHRSVDHLPWAHSLSALRTSSKACAGTTVPRTVL